jgi:hypothetical protein
VKVFAVVRVVGVVAVVSVIGVARVVNVDSKGPKVGFRVDF